MAGLTWKTYLWLHPYYMDLPLNTDVHPRGILDSDYHVWIVSNVCLYGCLCDLVSVQSFVTMFKINYWSFVQYRYIGDTDSEYVYFVICLYNSPGGIEHKAILFFQMKRTRFLCKIIIFHSSKHILVKSAEMLRFHNISSFT